MSTRAAAATRRWPWESRAAWDWSSTPRSSKSCRRGALMPLPEPSAAVARSLFLTGCTGYVGAFLARELMETTDANLYCLVRADDAAQGLDRLRETFANYQIWKDVYAQR